MRRELLPEVVQLDAPARLLLWSIRAWSAHHTDLSAIWWSLDRAFTAQGMAQALPPFHACMRALYAGLLRWPDIRCVECPYLGKEEESLLEMFTALQAGQERRARSRLQDWVVRGAINAAITQGLQCMREAAQSGWRLQSDFDATETSGVSSVERAAEPLSP